MWGEPSVARAQEAERSCRISRLSPSNPGGGWGAHALRDVLADGAWTLVADD
jgi:hypothetical protein